MTIKVSACESRCSNSGVWRSLLGTNVYVESVFDVEKNYVRDLKAKNDKTVYAYMLIVVVFLVVNFYSCLLITRSHELGCSPN